MPIVWCAEGIMMCKGKTCACMGRGDAGGICQYDMSTLSHEDCASLCKALELAAKANAYRARG